MTVATTHQPKPKPNAVHLIIHTGNELQEPAPLRAEPGSRVGFVIFNEDVIDHWVSIEPAEIVLKQDKVTKANPFEHMNEPIRVRPGDVEIIKQTIRAHHHFGDGKLPFTTYKYTLVSADDRAGTNAKFFDPDLDVSPPN